MEADLVPRAGLDFKAIPAAGLHGVGLARLPGNAIRLIQGFLAARPLIREFAPDALLLTGGYVGVPVALAASGISKLSYVPDLEPALALRWINRVADVVAVTAEETRRHIPMSRKVVVSGYPTRPNLRSMRKNQAREKLGLAADMSAVLVFGGSRGARSINEALWEILAELLGSAQVLHITGELDWPRTARMTEHISKNLMRNYHSYEYLDREMGLALAAADLAISRAGAAVLGEFPLFGLPAILIPYPHAWRYQRTNAEYLSQRGAAVLVRDQHLAEQLMPTIRSLLSDRQKLEEMSMAAKQLSKPNAAAEIAELLLELAGDGQSTNG
jgi:UDP-N-acetylglucosamine--N-acetylmuramyl-(pentapeptide) pyrophosphoryl-undecaprenol N-acetylglucosamine transferase